MSSVQYKKYTIAYKHSLTVNSRSQDYLRASASISADPGIESGWEERANWVLQLVDSPETVKRPVTSRTLHSVPVRYCSTKTPFQFVENLGFSFHHEYMEVGYTMTFPSSSRTCDIVFEVYQVWKPSRHLAAAEAERLGDHWIVQVYVDVPIGQSISTQTGNVNGANTANTNTTGKHASTASAIDQIAMQKAIEDLKLLKAELRAYCTLEPVNDGRLR